MGSFTDKDNDTGALGDPLKTTGQPQNPNRRRFSRTALASGAVLLSLGNRSAWGYTLKGTMSVATLNSFNPQTGMFISAPVGTRRTKEEVDLATTIHRIANPPDYLGREGVLRTCKKPGSLDEIILIQGNNCPS